MAACFRAALLSLIVTVAGALTCAAQPVPQPFPRPGTSPPPTAAPQPAPPPDATTRPAPLAPAADPGAPDEALLGVPIYPTARFIASYDAGQGQRYYLFGVTNPYAEIVAYYRTVLKDRGTVLYEEPPVHTWDTGRYRENTMAFPPSVTVKDYTWGGSKGYLVPLPGGQSQRFSTIIQIVPTAAGVP
jgi:hypothetical protein